MKRLSFLALASLLLVCLSACSSKEVAEADPKIGQPGDTVLVGNYHSLYPFVCKDSGMYSSTDMPGAREIEDLQTKGAGFMLEDGTKAKVLEIHKKDKTGRKIEILDGTHQGKTGFVSYKCLAKPENP